ncbi:MAG: hypothetical protein LBO62_08055, partial [Endomicrobium sp.]|nr:hypothetical protein [Endomicrobium sp.]
GVLRARTDKFSDAAIRRDNVSQGARQGLALGFLETPYNGLFFSGRMSEYGTPLKKCTNINF